jgi:L-fuconolactonase
VIATAHVERDMNIDSHQHFWRYSPRTHGWIDDSMRALKRDFLPRDLKPLLDLSGFDGSIAVQAALDVKETEWLLELTDEHDWIRGVVGWVDLCSDTTAAELERLSQHDKLVGIRHIVQSEPDPEFMLRDDFQRGIALLAKHDLVYDILVYHHQLPAAIELAARFPEQSFVLDHLGKPPIRSAKSGQRADWAAHVRELAQHTNVSCKLSGLVTEADWSQWKKPDFDFYLEVCENAFGPRRLMIGSDWPVCTLAGDYTRVIEIVAERIAILSHETRDAIMGGNAERIYALARAGA